MDEALRWLTTFSSPFHLVWFLLSMIVLVGTILASYYGRRWFHWCCIGHAIVAFETLLVLLFEADPDRVAFSPHCIWFNGLLALLYWKLVGTHAGPDESEER